MAAPLPQQDLDHILEHTVGMWDDLRGQSIFITGGTGFVGTWLLESLLWASDKLDLHVEVVVLTREPEKFLSRAPHLARHTGVRLKRGHVADFEWPDGRFPFVIHAATERYFEPDCFHPLGPFDIDVAGTRRVLEFARQRGVRRFLFTSSGAVYGRQPSDLTHVPEDYVGAPAPTDPSSAYGQAKRVSEFMCASYGRVFGFEAMIARLFAFVGPLLPLSENYAVGNFIGDALEGRRIHITGDGRPCRSYLYAADLAIWLWVILMRGKAGRSYNVGSMHEITIAHLASLIAPHGDVEIAGKPQVDSPPPRYVPSARRAEGELELACWIPIEQGIKRTLDWHRRCN